MKNTLSVLLLMVLGLSVLLISSCAKPTVPNFEEYGIPSSVWDYEHVVWFDLNYVDQAKGIADVEIWMSAKGVDPNASLTIGTQPISFNETYSYTEGEVYYGGEYSLNTDQLVSYKIIDGDNEYSGSISILPKKVEVAEWPVFDPIQSFAPSWTIADSPQFHVIDAEAEGLNSDIKVIRQIEGTERSYTIQQSNWSPIMPIDNFQFGINAIGYEMLERNKVLVVGVAGSYYDWPTISDKGKASRRSTQPFRFMDQIQQDINK